MTATLVLTVDVDAPVEQTWAGATDWAGQSTWMLGTRVEPTAQGGRGVGGGIEAFTGVGRVGFLDRMEITLWEPPRRCHVRHLGRVVRGTGAFEVEPAPGGRLELRITGEFNLAKARAAISGARDRSWRAYRAVESYSFSDSCRRRSLLDHFGDDTPGAPEGRCCDVCAGDSWLPSPDELEVKPAGRRAKSAPPPADLSP